MKGADMKPRVFIGSSKEHLALAYAIQECLDHDADVTVWTQSVFELSKSGLESLLALLDRVDYGVFVFAPDDLVTMRGKRMKSARDNVVFELVLFMGRLGRGRGFIIAPEGHSLHLPTDLLGTMPATYNALRAETEPTPALALACNAIRRVLTRPTTGTVSRIDGGFHLTLSPGHSIDLVTGAIQTVSPDADYGAVVLPANVSFDDACISDTRSALGAYFQTHFKSRIPEVRALIREQLGTDHIKTGGSPCTYPPGTTVYLDRPLKTRHRIMIVGVTEEIAGTGIQADTLSLIASLKSVMRLASSRRIAELWMPVMGTGHGGLDFSVAMTMTLVQLSNGILREGYHSIQRVTVIVYDPDGRRAAQVQRVAEAFPLLARP
jgi:O-acetyl-ADP-ribose deacetylase (regulator of RNase III)